MKKYKKVKQKWFLWYNGLGGYMFSHELVCDILEYINNNLNEEITTDELANRFYFDKTYIMKRFKKEIGKSIHDYINTIRILNSLDYYKYDNYILSIALRNGFNSIEYYSEIFRKVIGVSPMKYKKFINRSFDLSNDEIDTIINKVNECNNLKEYSNNYLMKRKPTVKMEKVFKL